MDGKYSSFEPGQLLLTWGRKNTFFLLLAETIRLQPGILIMISDMLVHIPTERSPRPVIDASLSLAAAIRAHLEAIAAGYIQRGIAIATNGIATDEAAIFELELNRATERSAAGLAVFETEARKARIPYRCRSIQNFPAGAASAVGAAARLYDLCIALQPDAAHDSFDNVTSRDILLHSGGPVLVIPYIFEGVFEARRIGICWDGSRCAARALRDAKPLLSRAEAAVVISINEVQVAPAEASAQKLMNHLARSEITASLIELTAEKSEIQPSILSLAADEGLDMLVMGAYGHSPMREGLFGGVTREMLNTMTVPALMSH